MCLCATEGQRKSVDPKSKATASLDRATRRLREGCHRRRSRQHYLQVRALGRWACGTGARWRLTLTCVPRWLAKGPVLREAIGYGGFVEPGDCVPSFLRTESLGRETARRLMSFCHWLIDHPHVCGRKLEVHMHRHFGSETVRGLGCERPGYWESSSCADFNRKVI